jgi:regulator of protease activity HflC (stomatin/prohibitin superfamily)
MSLRKLLVPVIALILLVIAANSLYTVTEVEQVIITQFGKPVGDPVVDAGLNTVRAGNQPYRQAYPRVGWPTV